MRPPGPTRPVRAALGRGAVVALAGLATLGHGEAAWAHIGFAANDLYAGMFHPLLHFSTILPVFALALWLARWPPRHLTSLAVAYWGAAIAGATAGWWLPELPVLDDLLLPLALMVGVLVALDHAPPVWLAAAAAGLIGLVEGLYNVTQVRNEVSDAVLFSAGLLLVLGLIPLHLTALLHGRSHLWVTTGKRVVGSWIATAAALVLALDWSGQSVGGI